MMLLDSRRATAYKIANICEKITKAHCRQQRKIRQTITQNFNVVIHVGKARHLEYNEPNIF